MGLDRVACRTIVKMAVIEKANLLSKTTTKTKAGADGPGAEALSLRYHLYRCSIQISTLHAYGPRVERES